MLPRTPNSKNTERTKTSNVGNESVTIRTGFVETLMEHTLIGASQKTDSKANAKHSNWVQIPSLRHAHRRGEGMDGLWAGSYDWAHKFTIKVTPQVGDRKGKIKTDADFCN